LKPSKTTSRFLLTLTCTFQTLSPLLSSYLYRVRVVWSGSGTARLGLGSPEVWVCNPSLQPARSNPSLSPPQVSFSWVQLEGLGREESSEYQGWRVLSLLFSKLRVRVTRSFQPATSQSSPWALAWCHLYPMMRYRQEQVNPQQTPSSLTLTLTLSQCLTLWMCFDYES